MKPFREYRKSSDGERVMLAKWRGRISVGGRRRKVVLFTDFKVSERELRRLQSEADDEVQGGMAGRRRKHSSRAIEEHIIAYVEHVGRTSKSAEHKRISEWMLRALVIGAGWNRLSDVTRESVEVFLKGLMLRDGETMATVSYQNCFIKRAKAFVNWCVPERLASSPLVGLKRGNTLRAVKRRARRAASDDELVAWLSKLPVKYHLSMALAVLAGFRRDEAEALRWSDLHLNATVPFIKLRPEWTKNGHGDSLPLHPDLVKLLREAGPGMPAMPVLLNVPDVDTLRKYLVASGGVFDVEGERLDYHALRHTFKNNLDRVGCSQVTKRALMRHANGEVTDGYSHVRLAELYAIVEQLPSPFAAVWKDVAAGVGALTMTGTDDILPASSSLGSGGTRVGQKPCITMHRGARPCIIGRQSVGSAESAEVFGNANSCVAVHGSADESLIVGAMADIVSETGPSTQVD